MQMWIKWSLGSICLRTAKMGWTTLYPSSTTSTIAKGRKRLSKRIRKWSNQYVKGTQNTVASVRRSWSQSGFYFQRTTKLLWRFYSSNELKKITRWADKKLLSRLIRTNSCYNFKKMEKDVSSRSVLQRNMSKNARRMNPFLNLKLSATRQECRRYFKLN